MTDEEYINNLPPHRDSTFNLWLACTIGLLLVTLIAFVVFGDK